MYLKSTGGANLSIEQQKIQVVVYRYIDNIVYYYQKSWYNGPFNEDFNARQRKTYKPGDSRQRLAVEQVLLSSPSNPKGVLKDWPCQKCQKF